MTTYISKIYNKNTENQRTVWYKVLETGEVIVHRDGELPAIEWADGSKSWWVNGKLHRSSEFPAIVWAHGSKEWRVDGERHREGGLPAVEHANGFKEWWANGKYDFSRGFPRFYDIYKETDKHVPTKESSNDFCDRTINQYLQENSLKPGCLIIIPRNSHYIELNSKEPNILRTNEEYAGVFIEKFNVSLNILFNNKLCSVRYNYVKRLI